MDCLREDGGEENRKAWFSLADCVSIFRDRVCEALQIVPFFKLSARFFYLHNNLTFYAAGQKCGERVWNIFPFSLSKKNFSHIGGKCNLAWGPGTEINSQSLFLLTHRRTNRKHGVTNTLRQIHTHTHTHTCPQIHKDSPCTQAVWQRNCETQLWLSPKSILSYIHADTWTHTRQLSAWFFNHVRL